MNSLACGFSVDFSEASEPTEELGDNAGPFEAKAVAFPQSEVDDVEELE